MTKSKAIAFNCTSLLLFNVVFWLCSYYPRHIVETCDTGFSVFGTIVNFMLVLLFCFSLTIFFCKGKTFFSKNIFESDLSLAKRFCLKKVLLSTLVFLLCDIIRSIAEPIFAERSFIFVDVLAVVTWLAVYSILTFKSHSFFKRSGYAITAFCVTIALLAIVILIDIRLTDKVSVLFEKYTSGSSDAYTLTNIDFLHSIYFAIFDFLVGSTFIIFHYLSATAENCHSGDGTSWDKRRSVYKTVSRFAILCIMTGVIFILKIFIYPADTFAGHSVSGEKNTVYVPMEKFDIDVECVTINRFHSRNSKRPVYCATNVVIRYDNIITAEFTVDRIEKATIIESEGNDIIIKDNFTEYAIDNTKVYVFAYDAVSFVENGTPKTIMFSDINEVTQESAMLTATCKSMISEGNIAVFECSYKYLLKYDKEFIQPYIDRYSEGNFNEQERTFFNKHRYNESYIINLVR